MSISTVSPPTARRATLDDLARYDRKAEFIGGKIVPQMPSGFQPNRTASRIFRGLDDHAESTGQGMALTDNTGLAIPALPSGRESFSPDAAFYLGPLPENLMGFIQGPPTLAVEVRSEPDDGSAAEKSMAAKRDDYFQAQTLVVWDLDLIARCVRKYQAQLPDQPVVFSVGEQADAEPAVPGWRMPVDQIFS